MGRRLLGGKSGILLGEVGIGTRSEGSPAVSSDLHSVMVVCVGPATLFDPGEVLAHRCATHLMTVRIGQGHQMLVVAIVPERDGRLMVTVGAEASHLGAAHASNTSRGEA